jgi:hypothetical protein
MNTESQKVKVAEAFSMFNENQQQALKMIVRQGFWGDTDMTFNDEECYYSYGYFTNMGNGKQYSGTLSGISKKIKSSGTNLIFMCSDWWGDGSGDMMFFNMELIEEADLKSWSEQ